MLDANSILSEAPRFLCTTFLSMYSKRNGWITAASLEEPTKAKEILKCVSKALIDRDNHSMGIRIVQLTSGKDIALEKSVLNPIQFKLNELAAHMKNIIHIIVDSETKNCILVDAVMT